MKFDIILPIFSEHRPRIATNMETYMRAITINKPSSLDTLSVIESPEPTPGHGEIVVQWRASSLNYHDYLVAIGMIPVVDGRIPLSDGAGDVVAIGEGVTKWKVGDKVMSAFFPNWIEGKVNKSKTLALFGDTVDGCAADKSCIGQDSVSRMPDGYSYAEAATLPCAALTAWRALIVEGNLQAGDTVLVEGTGGMSVFALQIAKAAGAYVYATTSCDDKIDQLKKLGADTIINYKTDPKWGSTIHKLSNGGVDHVLDIGGSTTLNHSIDAAKVGGHISLIGILGGFTAEMMLPKIFGKHIRMTGLSVGSVEMQNAMVKAINISGLRPIIDRSFAFQELGTAFRYQETGKHFGKIVIEY
ncbi:zinc-dependent alcohol dehydrogenase family protein [Zhongshania sp. BJYM1]|uniref:zinc-dependent alcohol dehydrogenase family protein n=1 Tax=Zhongshania aquatica TaxID=2965069 RepID=UPI0022B53AEE|nr:NAD(P)-dependent alcohol dehydrogenase [Marortus sp. BJYM1]